MRKMLQAFYFVPNFEKPKYVLNYIYLENKHFVNAVPCEMANFLFDAQSFHKSKTIFGSCRAVLGSVYISLAKMYFGII